MFYAGKPDERHDDPNRQIPWPHKDPPQPGQPVKPKAPTKG